MRSNHYATSPHCVSSIDLYKLPPVSSQRYVLNSNLKGKSVAAMAVAVYVLFAINLVLLF